VLTIVMLTPGLCVRERERIQQGAAFTYMYLL
jgi:hypothetical protein